MRVVTTADELKAVGGDGCVFVPTMGALHAGHASLIRHAAGLRRDGVPLPVVVSVFVNPSQFNDRADLERYPRTLDADVEICREAGADWVFAPSVDEVYPPGREIAVPPLPEVATRPGLEDAHRPGHFAGVCQVVARLFEMVNARAAVFGEKDWQQLQVVRAMVRAGTIAVRPRIEAAATMRESDGLAMSSRNRFLDPAERERAGAISRALCEAAGEASVAAAESRMGDVLDAAGLAVEYAVVRHAETLMAAAAGQSCRALIAARLGAVRLIDNAAWPG